MFIFVEEKISGNPKTLVKPHFKSNPEVSFISARARAKSIFDSTTMRRVNGLAVLGRAVAGIGGATGGAQRRLLHSQILTSCSHSSPLWFTQPLLDRFGQSRSSRAQGFEATMHFSVSATSLAQDIQAAKEKFQPKDVVLYQYEACPFCNKVKGEFHSFNFLSL